MNLRRYALGIARSVCVVLLVSVGVGEALTWPASRTIGEAPADLHATSIVITTPAGEQVSGWFGRGVKGQGTILLLHGVRADRTQMVERARLFARLGYGVLLIDLPAHGESSGSHITFGLKEGEGVAAALAYLQRELPTEPVAVVGVSLGAAALVLAKATPAPAAVVLESMYPTITEAVTDRLTRHLGAGGGLLAPLLLWQFPLILGIDVDSLRPIHEIAFLHAPVLIASGTKDLHTTLAESQRIYDAAQEPKAYWPVDGAAHVDLYRFNRKAYEARVLPFIAKYLPRVRG